MSKWWICDRDLERGDVKSGHVVFAASLILIVDDVLPNIIFWTWILYLSFSSSVVDNKHQDQNWKIISIITIPFCKYQYSSLESPIWIISIVKLNQWCFYSNHFDLYLHFIFLTWVLRETEEPCIIRTLLKTLLQTKRKLNWKTKHNFYAIIVLKKLQATLKTRSQNRKRYLQKYKLNQQLNITKTLA